MDKEWVFLHRRDAKYMDGLQAFISNAVALAAIDGNIKCPCKSCANRHRLSPIDVEHHLEMEGMDELEVSRSVIANLQDETAKKNDEMQAIKSQLNVIDARLDTPLHSILSGGADSINKFVAALTQIAGEKQAQAISQGMHAVATPSEGYRSLLSN